MEDLPPSGFVLIGEVDRVRGLIGEVVVTVHSDDPDRMSRLAAVFMRGPGGDLVRVEIEGVKKLHHRSVLKLAGYESIEQGKTLIGKELFIPREDSTPAPEGQYYAYQLIGLDVCLEEGVPVGRVEGILRQGAQSLLVIRGAGREILIPFVPEICVNVDLERKFITVNPPDGLLDL